MNGISFPEEFFNFIRHHSGEDPASLLFKYGSHSYEYDLRNAIMQISCRRKASDKLKPFLSKDNFLFPDALAAEQASDWRVASIHADLIGDGKSVVDLTAGLGIDAMTIAAKGNRVIAVERNELKADFLCFNSRVMSLDSLIVKNDDAESFIAGLTDYPDTFFIDPARRDDVGKRLYAFEDCSPDIRSFYKNILAKGSDIWIKASPMLDITAVAKTFEGIDRIYSISLKGECKEILIHIVPDALESGIELIAIDLDGEGKLHSGFIMNFEEDKSPKIYKEEAPEEGYLYLPTASLLKLPASGSLCSKFENLYKLSSNTEIYYSPLFHDSFPGRSFRIKQIITKNDFKSLKGGKANVICRNYTEDAESLRKRLRLLQGESTSIIGCRIGITSRPIIFKAEKIKG